MPTGCRLRRQGGRCARGTGRSGRRAGERATRPLESPAYGRSRLRPPGDWSYGSLQAEIPRGLVIEGGSRTSKDRFFGLSAPLLRIERRRIVLQNGSRREELALEQDEGKATRARGRTQRRPRAARATRPPRAARAARPTPPRAAARPQVERLAENRFAVTRSDVQNLASNPSSLLNSSQGRILPKYENGQMVGFQVNAIRPGSPYGRSRLRPPGDWSYGSLQAEIPRGLVIEGGSRTSKDRFFGLSASAGCRSGPSRASRGRASAG